MEPPNAVRGWFGITLFAVLAPIMFLAAYPGWKTTLILVALGLLAVIGLAVALRTRGLTVLAVIGRTVDGWMQSAGGGRKEPTIKRVPRPTGYWKAQLIEAVGGQCEIQSCRDIGHLEVHHIHEHAQGGSNELRNLLVLCPNHHKQAGSGAINKERQRALAARPGRYGNARFRQRWQRNVVAKAADAQANGFAIN